jgi:kynurenine 3-monooxygenase
MEKILVIGAGLCGTLLAVRLAQRGYQVELHEKRPDMRKTSMIAGRSINLALSNRGLKALRLIGMEEQVQEACIPMPGRLIHPIQGDMLFAPYSGRKGEFINSVSRGGLNCQLLDEAEKYPNLSLQFNSGCTAVDLKAARATFRDEQTGAITTKEATVVFGTDGSGSALRQAMLAQTPQLLFNYSQDFLQHGYKELHIPPGADGGWQIEKNALHIWPRGSYMVIALPNMDGSFTVTLFLPYDGTPGFKQLENDAEIRQFFQEKFADIVPLLPNLTDDFKQNPTGNLGTIKCYPWQAFGKTLLLGDAAHAIVPFYGQGMNASFEDVVVLDQFIEQYQGDWATILPEFENLRKRETDAIADLAVDNFYEMRDHTANPVFQRKRLLETRLEQTFPDYFSKYSLVTFRDDVNYADAMLRGRKQDELLMKICEHSDTNWDLDLVKSMIIGN